jgi:hemerythrin-like metal-binding protein
MDRSSPASHPHLRLGQEPVDDEHGVQLGLLEALHAALGPGGRRGGAAELVDRLLVFSDMHFGSEELLMRLDAYPRYGEHVDDHRRLLAQLREIEARVRGGADARALADGLRRAFGGHIATHDRAFAGYHPEP